MLTNLQAGSFSRACDIELLDVLGLARCIQGQDAHCGGVGLKDKHEAVEKSE